MIVGIVTSVVLSIHFNIIKNMIFISNDILYLGIVMGIAFPLILILGSMFLT